MTPLPGEAVRPSDAEPFEPVSLGEVCSVKFQICRRLYLDRHPGGSVDVVREALDSGRAGQVFARHIFDWQVTPAAALLRYLETDFSGVFEREDLMASEAGEVTHRHLGTRHPHDFHAVAGQMDDAVLDGQYASARARFDHLAARFRRHLQRPGRFLYILNTLPPEALVERLTAALGAGGGDHRFHLLLAAGEAEDAGSAFEGLVSRARLAAGPPKPADRMWEGDDDAWDAVFRRYPIRPPQGDGFTIGLHRRVGETPPPGRVLPLGWMRLPERAPAGPLPSTFTTPAAAWDYGAISDGIEPTAGSSVFVDLQGIAGEVGVSLTDGAGGALISREHRLGVTGEAVRIALSLRGASGPAHILLRNYGAEGIAGVVKVDRVAVA